MIERKRTRGRPKGTGLDDTQTLEDIAALMAADPELKPTTAIRKLGIDNESVIRRLRDKLKASDIAETTLRVKAGDPQTRRPASDRTWAEAAAPQAVMSLEQPRDAVKCRAVKPTPRLRRERRLPKGTATARKAAQAARHASRPACPDPIAALPVAMFAAACASAHFLAVQQSMLWQAGVRHALSGRSLKTS